MPGQFEGFGIEFMYPDSWTVDSDSGSNSVFIESPDGAFMAITQCAPQATAEEALAKARQAMQEDYDEIERESVVKQLAGLTLSGEVLRFVYLDLIVTSQLLSITHAEASYFVQTQAEDRDHDKLSPVFDAMLTSFCQNLAGKK